MFTSTVAVTPKRIEKGGDLTKIAQLCRILQQSRRPVFLNGLMHLRAGLFPNSLIRHTLFYDGCGPKYNALFEGLPGPFLGLQNTSARMCEFGT